MNNSYSRCIWFLLWSFWMIYPWSFVRIKTSLHKFQKNSIPFFSVSPIQSNQWNNDLLLDQEKNTNHNIQTILLPENHNFPMPYSAITKIDLNKASIYFEAITNNESIIYLDISIQNKQFIIEKIKGHNPMGFLPQDILESLQVLPQITSITNNQPIGKVQLLNQTLIIPPNTKITWRRYWQYLPVTLLRVLKVSYIYSIKLQKPIGLEINQTYNQKVMVTKILPSYQASLQKKIAVGDVLLGIKSTWGSRLWKIYSFEDLQAFVSPLPNQITSSDELNNQNPSIINSFPSMIFQFQRNISLVSLCYSQSIRQIYHNISLTQYLTWNNIQNPQQNPQRNPQQQYLTNQGSQPSSIPRIKEWETILSQTNSISSLKQMWFYLKSTTSTTSTPTSVSASSTQNTCEYLSKHHLSTTMNNQIIHQLILKAIALDAPEVAIDIFGFYFGFQPQTKNSSTIKKHWKATGFTSNDYMTWLIEYIQIGQQNNATQLESSTLIQSLTKNTLFTVTNPFLSSHKRIPSPQHKSLFQPTHHIITSICKAYGLLYHFDQAYQVVQWYEHTFHQVIDITMITNLLYIAIKCKQWNYVDYFLLQDIPQRRLPFSDYTINALFLAFTKQCRYDEIMMIYHALSSLFQTSNQLIITQGMLIQSLIRIDHPFAHQTIRQILSSFTKRRHIYPTIELYNQLFRHYSNTNNYRQMLSLHRTIRHYNQEIQSQQTQGRESNTTSSSSKTTFLTSLDFSSAFSSTKPLQKTSNTNLIHHNTENHKNTTANIPIIKFNYLTYSYFLRCFSNAKQISWLLKYYSYMKQDGWIPNEYIYMFILKGLSHQQNVLFALHIFIEMYQHHVYPDTHHYTLLLFMMLRNQRLDLFIKFFDVYLMHLQLFADEKPLSSSPPSNKSPINKESLTNKVTSTTQPSSSSSPPSSPSSQTKILDIGIMNLYVSSLCQLRKWDEINHLLYLMNHQYQEIHTQRSYPKPTIQTYITLFQYQILDEQFDAAKQTFVELITFSMKDMSSNQSHSQQHPFTSLFFIALHFALRQSSHLIAKKFPHSMKSTLSPTSSASTSASFSNRLNSTEQENNLYQKFPFLLNSSTLSNYLMNSTLTSFTSSSKQSPSKAPSTTSNTPPISHIQHQIQSIESIIEQYSIPSSSFPMQPKDLLLPEYRFEPPSLIALEFVVDIIEKVYELGYVIPNDLKYDVFNALKQNTFTKESLFSRFQSIVNHNNIYNDKKPTKDH